MRVPHRNNPPCAIARRPNHHHQPAGEKSGCDIPHLAIILPVIRRGGMGAVKHRSRICEIQPSIGQSGGALRGIVGHLHRFIVATEMRGRKMFTWSTPLPIANSKGRAAGARSHSTCRPGTGEGGGYPFFPLAVACVNLTNLHKIFQVFGLEQFFFAKKNWSLLRLSRDRDYNPRKKLKIQLFKE